MADNQRKSRGVFFDHIVKEGEPSEMYIGDKPKSVGEVTMKVSLDVSEALTGLKGLQREAREAAKALRELEEVQKRPKIHDYVTFPIDGKYVGGKIITKIDEESAQSITDDIRRSYEIGGDGE